MTGNFPAVVYMYDFGTVAEIKAAPSSFVGMTTILAPAKAIDHVFEYDARKWVIRFEMEIERTFAATEYVPPQPKELKAAAPRKSPAKAKAGVTKKKKAA